MRARIAGLAALLLAGCSSAGGITSHKPTLQATTAKMDKIYASCVLERWKALSPEARMVERADGFQVVVPNTSGGTEELLMVRGRVDGADVALYEWFEVLALRAYRESAHACL